MIFTMSADMTQKTGKQKNVKRRSPSLGSKKHIVANGTKKTGWLKRFLKWIGQGTDTSSSGRSACPT